MTNCKSSDVASFPALSDLVDWPLQRPLFCLSSLLFINWSRESMTCLFNDSVEMTGPRSAARDSRALLSQVFRSVNLLAALNQRPANVSKRFSNIQGELTYLCSPLHFDPYNLENEDVYPLPHCLCGACGCTAGIICGLGCRLGYLSQTRRWS